MAMPFPGYLGKHPSMDEIISLCNQKDIAVHLDCAWMSCAFDINFNFGKPESVSASHQGTKYFTPGGTPGYPSTFLGDKGQLWDKI